MIVVHGAKSSSCYRINGNFTYAGDSIFIDFSYSGGAYVEVAVNEKPIDVINVYDYEHGESTIERFEDFKKAVDEYCEYASVDDLIGLYKNG